MNIDIILRIYPELKEEWMKIDEHEPWQIMEGSELMRISNVINSFKYLDENITKKCRVFLGWAVGGHGDYGAFSRVGRSPAFWPCGHRQSANGWNTNGNAQRGLNAFSLGRRPISNYGCWRSTRKRSVRFWKRLRRSIAALAVKLLLRRQKDGWMLSRGELIAGVSTSRSGGQFRRVPERSRLVLF